MPTTKASQTMVAKTEQALGGFEKLERGEGPRPTVVVYDLLKNEAGDFFEGDFEEVDGKGSDKASPHFDDQGNRLTPYAVSQSVQSLLLDRHFSVPSSSSSSSNPPPPHSLLLLSHPPLYTTGTSPTTSLPPTPSIPVIPSNRGGDVTTTLPVAWPFVRDVFWGLVLESLVYSR